MMQVHRALASRMSRPARQTLWRLCSCKLQQQGRIRHFAGDVRQAQDAAKDMLAKAAAPLSAKISADACSAFLAAYAALGARERVQWWALQALSEQESQLEVLGRSLPRGGGRLAPQLLDSFRPAAPGPTEVILRQIVAVLGANAGLTQALRFRAELRAAAVAVGPRTAAGFALERLDRDLQDVLSLWFSPGLVEISIVDHNSAPQVQQAALAVARAADETAELSLLSQADAGSHHRCYALTHPQMREPETSSSASAPPVLLCAHAALLRRLPETLAEVHAAAPSAEEPPGAVCFWALAATTTSEDGGSSSSQPTDGLRGLGLGTTLLREATQRLRAEAASAGAGDDVVVGALTPLRGFADWLRKRRAWEGLEPRLAGTLQRVLEASAVTEGTREIRFVDVDGDAVFFCSTPERGLEVSVGEGPLSKVVRIRVSEDNRYVRFLTGGESPTALQVEAPADVAERGDLAEVARMAEAAGILPIELRDLLLKLGIEYLLRKAKDGKRLMDPIAHFHLIAGASLRGLLWRADESPSGLAESLGFMVSFVYEPAREAENAALYLERGFVASPTLSAGAS